MYLLDTNICIYAMKNRYITLTEKLLTVPPAEIAISSVTVGELAYGAEKSRWGAAVRHQLALFLAPFDILPFTEADARVFGRIRAALTMAGQPIGPYDLMIAAQGLARGLTVVTHNVREFCRVDGLQVEDWAVES